MGPPSPNDIRCAESAATRMSRFAGWDGMWRRRAATLIGALALGLVALAFATLADGAQRLFERLVAAAPLAPLALTPLGFAGIAWLTRRLAPAAKGSGIPQVIVNARNPEAPALRPLTSL